MVGPRLPSIVIVVVTALLGLSGCATTADVSASGTQPAVEPITGPTADELNQLLARAAESLEFGNHAEALHDFVLLTLVAPDSDHGRRAASELDRLSSALRLEPAAQWLAPDGSQESASTRELKSTGAPLPSVIATIGEGPARVAVHGLTIQFTVTEGGAQGPSVLVPTSEFGTATAPIHSNIAGSRPISVFATPVVLTDRGQIALASRPLVFTYVPPASVFIVLTATLVEDEVAPAPELGGAVAVPLRAIGSVAVQDGSSVNGFLGAYSGDPEAIRAILDANDASLLGVAVLDVQAISQVEYQGQLYNIWKADAVVRLLFFDAVGGRSLVTLTSKPLAGQGGSRLDALVDIARVGAEALDVLMGANGDEFRTLVTGSRE
ncbi:MAG: hypothetical protein KOO61_00665 [Spirochaetales bacterium]|nr:hypothetical protein [Spirochaetales bacterium]